MADSPFKNIGYVILRDSTGKMSWQSIDKPIENGTLLFAQQDRNGTYFNGARYDTPVSAAEGETLRLLELTREAEKELYQPIVEALRQEFVALYGDHKDVHEILGNTAFLEVVVKGAGIGLKLPSNFKGLDVRWSRLEKPCMNG